MFDPENEDNNLTDTNGAPGAMDEDGSEDTVNDSDDVNTPPEGDGEDVAEEEESYENIQTVPEDDDSQVINMLTVHVYHPKGAIQVHTDILVGIPTPTGMQNKRLVVTGGVTVKRLCELLQGVATW